MPWTDRAGRLSPLRLAVFCALWLPAAWIAWLAATQGLGAEPWDAAIGLSGDWALRIFLLSLLVTPARQILRAAPLADLRRMVGLGAAAYAALHLGLYVGDQGGDLPRVAAEILSRVYLLIGFAALLGLALLAATSTDGMVRRLGGAAWRRLHRLVHPIALLALAHFTLQSKANVTEPMVMWGLYAWLAGYRLVAPAGGAPGVARLAALACAAAGLTAGLEFAWYALATGIDPWRVLAANWDGFLFPRPAAWVLGAGLLAVLARAVRPRRAARPGRAGLAPA